MATIFRADKYPGDKIFRCKHFIFLEVTGHVHHTLAGHPSTNSVHETGSDGSPVLTRQGLTVLVCMYIGYVEVFMFAQQLTA